MILPYVNNIDTDQPVNLDSGASCSKKLTTSLVNVLLKFHMLITNTLIHFDGKDSQMFSTKHNSVCGYIISMY